jgi:hypothetical protein
VVHEHLSVRSSHSAHNKIPAKRMVKMTLQR